MTNVNPDMIVIARESRELTQGALAGMLSITQATLSKFETGTLTVGDKHLAAVAKVLEYPVGFFAQEDQVRWVGSGCMYNRKRQSLTATEYRRLLARVNVLRLSIWRLLNTVEIETENRFVRIDLASLVRQKKLLLW